MRKQPTFRAATTGYSAKQRLRNEHKNSILVAFTGYPYLGFALIGWRTFRSRLTKKHYPDLGSDPSSVWNLCSLCSDVILRENHSCFRWVSILRLTKRQTFWRHLKRSTRCHQEGSKWGGSFDDWRLYFSNFYGWRLNFRAFDGWRLFSGTDFVHQLH